ncbi:basic proline-rich protein-like [Podarcis raffonei]|uniref:basic proline-rich protein-like n=1 Tax=Podarcis raffonei TaxID=65483 RepID=UPI0023297CA7|nr:basic proline-rich protein-like [Podarcis raffonei]
MPGFGMLPRSPWQRGPPPLAAAALRGWAGEGTRCLAAALPYARAGAPLGSLPRGRRNGLPSPPRSEEVSSAPRPAPPASRPAHARGAPSLLARSDRGGTRPLFTPPHPALPQPLTPLPPSPPPPPPGRSRSRLHPGARQPPRTPPPQFSNAASARARAASARRAAHCVSSGGLWLHCIYDNKLKMILYQEHIISNNFSDQKFCIEFCKMQLHSGTLG